MFRLKKGQPEFTIVDGPCQGSYRHGRTYKDVPEAYRDRFERVKTEGETPGGGDGERKQERPGDMERGSKKSHSLKISKSPSPQVSQSHSPKVKVPKNRR